MPNKSAVSPTAVASFAEQLRLAIIESERPLLDYIQEKGFAQITIDQTDEAINALFAGRFIEP